MNKLLCFLFSISLQLIAFSTEGQTTISADKQKLLDYISPANDSARKAHNLLEHATRGKWAGYNIDSMRTAYEGLALKSRQREIDFMMQNPDNYAAMEHFYNSMLHSYIYKLDSIVAIFSNFSNDLKATPLGRATTEVIDKKKGLGLHAIMPTFSFKTSTGEEINLPSFRHKKYVLLCFWDSGCLPCIKSIPTLKNMYEKYGQELQIIHVSLDGNENKWRSSLSKFPMPWPQTIDLAPYNKGSKLKEMYSVYFIPQYFLIDRDGKLVYHNAFYEEYDVYPVLQDVLHKVMAQ